MARLNSKSDADAARKIDIDKSAVCKWPNKADLDRAVSLLLIDKILGATIVLKDNVIDAAEVLADSLTNRDVKARIAAANSILDRVGVSEKKRIEMTGKDGNPVKILVEYVNDWRDTFETTDAPSGGEAGDSG